MKRLKVSHRELVPDSEVPIVHLEHDYRSFKKPENFDKSVARFKEAGWEELKL